MVTKKDKESAWDGSATIRWKNTKTWSRDENGNVCRHGTNGEFGWETDHYNPKVNGGTDYGRNPWILNTQDNREKCKEIPGFAFKKKVVQTMDGFNNIFAINRTPADLLKIEGIKENNRKKYKVIQDYDLKNKVVLIRTDLNVPFSLDGSVSDLSRIESIKKTVDYCIANEAKVILMSHFGRPTSFSYEMSLQRLVGPIAHVLSRNVIFESSLDNINCSVNTMSPMDILLTENLRFYDGETRNDLRFARSLADLADIYVNDAFSCSHRSHASVDAITGLIPSCLGFAVQEELSILSSVTCRKPVCAIVGGSKISTKVSLLTKLAASVDFLVLGGAIANGFLVNHGIGVGKSMVESGVDNIIKDIMKISIASGCSIVLPSDVVVGNDRIYSKSVLEVDEGEAIFDVGSNTVCKISRVVDSCKAVIMNGPLGVFEKPEFCKGTFAILKKLSEVSKNPDITVVLGGGDTVAALKSCQFGYSDFDHVSTGGGAFLQWFADGESSLPGIKALLKFP